MNVRPELAEHLQRRVQAFGEGFRHNLALLGPAGSGKTFQLRQVVTSHPAAVGVIYCPLYREAPRAFLERLGCAIVQGGVGMGQPPGATLPSLDALLTHAEGHTPKTAAAIRSAAGLLPRRLYAEALTRMLDAIPVLNEESRRSAVLILDEFLYLDELGFGHAFHELGKRVMTWPSTLFILSSSSCYRARLILRERLQLLFGQFELITLEALQPAIATGWVHQELRGVRGASDMAPFLTHWVGGFPWYVAIILQRIRERSLLARRPQPTETLWFDAMWDVLGNPQGPLHQWCSGRIDGLTRLRGGPRALEVLLQLAQGARTVTAISAAVGRAGMSASLQLLLEQDLVERMGTCWRMTDPLLRCWLAAIFAPRRCGMAVEEAALRQQLEAHLQALWERWMQTQQLAFADQVVRLFGKFCEDTVLLDAKTGRLPKFHTMTTQPVEGRPLGAYLIADSPGRRWCASIHEDAVDEGAVARFEQFCRSQHPRPCRKLVVTRASLDPAARVMAKAASMWVWEVDEINLLMELYAHV